MLKKFSKLLQKLRKEGKFPFELKDVYFPVFVFAFELKQKMKVKFFCQFQRIEIKENRRNAEENKGNRIENSCGRVSFFQFEIAIKTATAISDKNEISAGRRRKEWKNLSAVA